MKMKRFVLTAALVALPASAVAQPALPPPPAPPPAPAPASPAPAATPAAAPAQAAPAADGTYGPHQGWLGISLGLPAGGAPTAGISYFLSDSGALKLDVGIDFGTKASVFRPGFSLEVGYRAYIAKAGNLSPFVQPSAFFARPGTGGDFLPQFSMAFNVGLGAEYFFSDHLSVSGQTGVGVSFRDEFKTINFTTGTSGIFGNLYW